MGEGTTDQKPRQQVLSGESFRLRVNSQDAGQVYVVAVDANARGELYSDALASLFDIREPEE